ncbi:unnamed protein product [Effrenium voratum]|nr:unnamed protein product [Effrenium voratum]
MSNMKEFKAVIPLAVSVFFLVIYVTVLLVRFEDTLLAPPTQRVMRDVSVVRLPRLFFCPADRYKQARLIWNSYECSLSYKTEVGACTGRLQHFGGEEPEDFKHGSNWSTACLEFGTHRIGVKQEWSAAWNQISLKEIELGYLPKEWEVGAEPTTIERYYAPLLRVPIYQPTTFSMPGSGVVTRLYLATEEDHGRHEAGEYWYTYGATTIPVVNATVPEQQFLHERGEWVKAPSSRRAVAEVVITLEDFTRYEYRVQPVIYPLLSLLSEVSGVFALFCWAFVKGPLVGRRFQKGQEGKPEDEEQPRVALHDGMQYRSIEAEAEDPGSVGKARRCRRELDDWLLLRLAVECQKSGEQVASTDAVAMETSFDRLLLDGFARVAGAGLLRSQPSNISRRRLDGNLGVCIQFSSTHFAKKRKANDQQSVVMPADPQAFNFTKIKEEEVVGVVEASGMQVVCMVCASPLSVGHMLLVPQRDKVYPQVLTEEFLMCGLRLLALSGRLDIRVLFNSLLGHASVNHFHLHAIYLELCGFGNGFANGIGAARFPVEKAERSKLGGGRGVGQVCAEILVEGRWYCRGLVLSAGAPRGSETDGGPEEQPLPDPRPGRV